MSTKPFYKSKIIGVAALGLLYAIYEHFLGPDAVVSLRGIVDMAIPLVIMVFRTFYTSTTIE